jgi:organic hydroperoxide reductase OsmC/OhrA
MSSHRTTVTWKRQGQVFDPKFYCRDHVIRLEDGQTIAASGAAANLPPDTVGDQTADPEELFVASLASCHMLWFLAIAARKRFVVDYYEDQAHGDMANENGVFWMEQVQLRPSIQFGGDNQPTAEQLTAMHQEAHQRCFIANSVKTGVRIEPRSE